MFCCPFEDKRCGHTVAYFLIAMELAVWQGIAEELSRREDVDLAITDRKDRRERGSAEMKEARARRRGTIAITRHSMALVKRGVNTEAQFIFIICWKYFSLLCLEG